MAIVSVMTIKPYELIDKYLLNAGWKMYDRELNPYIDATTYFYKGRKGVLEVTVEFGLDDIWIEGPVNAVVDLAKRIPLPNVQLIYGTRQTSWETKDFKTGVRFDLCLDPKEARFSSAANNPHDPNNGGIRSDLLSFINGTENGGNIHELINSYFGSTELTHFIEVAKKLYKAPETGNLAPDE